MKGVLRASDEDEESSYPDTSCVICDRVWTDPDRVFRLDCGHVVHRKCWRGAAADDGCPECAETDSQFEARMASWENLVVLAKAYQAQRHADPPAAAATAGSRRSPPSAEAPAGRRPAASGAAAAAQTGGRRAPADAAGNPPPRRRPPSQQQQQQQPTAPLLPRPQQREQLTDASSASQSLASFSSGNRSHAATSRPDTVLATPRPAMLPMPHQQQPHQQQAPPTRRPVYDPSFDHDLVSHAGVAPPSRTHDSGGSVSRRPASFVVSPNASFSSSGAQERLTTATAAWGGDGQQQQQAASSSGRRGSQASASSRDVFESSFDNFVLATDDRSTSSVVRRRVAGVPLSAFDAPSPQARPRAHSRAFI